jgi:DNA-binding SARP family transcriptional activator
MTSAPDTALAFGLLGPVAVWRDGRVLDLGTPQQRALFALLLLHRNEVVSTDRLRDTLWPGELPPNALQVLRTYVSRLRTGALGPAAASPLRTHHHGYELRAAAHAVDVPMQAD